MSRQIDNYGDDERYQAYLRNQYEKEKRRKRAIKRKKYRQKRIISLIASAVFVAVVFFVVGNAFMENVVADLGGVGLSITKPSVMQGEDRKEDVLTILVAVTDEDELRTDALILVYYDKANQIVNLLNIPRDTYSNATNQNKKVNSAYVVGIENTIQMVEDLTGIRPDKYVVANFYGLAQTIDIIGGVEVTIPFRMKYDDPEQDLYIDLQEGTQVLNGEQAVHFLRWRKNNEGIYPEGYANGDLGRIENTQAFIQTLKSQLFQASTIFKIPQMVNNAFFNIDTDFTLAEIMWAGTSALSIEVTSYMLPGEDAYRSGVSYYLPFEDEILELINESFNPLNTPVTSLNLLD